jgi:hypothetical protein
VRHFPKAATLVMLQDSISLSYIPVHGKSITQDRPTKRWTEKDQEGVTVRWGAGYGDSATRGECMIWNVC